MPARWKRLDHIAKLVHGTQRILPGTVGLMGCKKRDGRIAPIVDETCGTILRIELEHGEKFDSGDAQIVQIGNLLHESAKSAASIRCDPGVRMTRESFYMHFVNDRLGGRPVERCVALPVVQTWIHDHAFHRRGQVGAFLLCRLAGVVARNGDSTSVWVDEEFGRIKPHPFIGIGRTMHTVSIKLARLRTRN